MWLAVLWMVLLAVPCRAQRFSVVSVKTHETDVSAFITPVRDLNGQACALLKVEAPKEFDFSTPLGIVKRVDEMGEIWLYVPAGTKQITLKHPEWGVLRNYRFSAPLESRMCYVMKVNIPQPEIVEVHDTVVVTQTLRDTVTVKYRRPPVPWSGYVLADVSLHKGGPSFGLFAAALKRHGLFAHAATNFRRTGDTMLEVDGNGYMPDSDVMPFYSGRKRQSHFMVTAGPVHRVGKHFCVFEGAGYGKSNVAWELDPLEGGGWVLCADHSHKGVAAEVGLLFHVRRVAVMASASTIKFEQWQVHIGAGIRIGKKR